MSYHARLRCAEMGISTKVAKRVVRNHTCSWTNPQGEVVATSDDHPEYTVVYSPADPPVVITVLYRTQDIYIRAT